jgi:hypothetical protein
VDDGISAGQRGRDRITVAHVASHELDVVMEIIRPSPLCAVDLRIEIIKDSYVSTSPEEGIGHMRTDESRSAGNQHCVTHEGPSRCRFSAVSRESCS